MKTLSNKNNRFTTIFITNSQNQFAPSCRILPRGQTKNAFHKTPGNLCKTGHFQSNQGETKQ